MSDPTAQWFALMVKPRFEKSVSGLLRSKGFEELMPISVRMQEWSDRRKLVEFPLFPRYLFCRFSFEERLPVLNTPGVLRIVGFGPKPCHIPESEIEALRKAVRSGVPLQNCEYMAVGQKVRVTNGPLTGVEGLFVEAKPNARVVLSIHLLQRSVCAEVDLRSTMRIESAPVRIPPRLVTHEAHSSGANQ